MPGHHADGFVGVQQVIIRIRPKAKLRQRDRARRGVSFRQRRNFDFGEADFAAVIEHEGEASINCSRCCYRRQARDGCSCAKAQLGHPLKSAIKAADKPARTPSHRPIIACKRTAGMRQYLACLCGMLALWMRLRGRRRRHPPKDRLHLVCSRFGPQAGRASE
jgi:hypothetical protein